MALAYSSALQTAIALRLTNRAYSSLTSDQRNAIDANWSAGTPGGHAGEALTLIESIANFVEASGADQAPDAWASWLVHEVCWRASLHVAPDLHSEYRRLRDEAMLLAIRTYASTDADDDTATAGLALSKINIRRHVLAHGVMIDPIKFLRPDLIDANIKAAIQIVWHRALWSWRRYPDSVTFASGATREPTPTFGSGETPHSIASERLYYTGSGSDNWNGAAMIGVSADRMARLRAEYADASAGRPRYFHTNRRGTGASLDWQIEIDTDAEYTLRGEFYSALPDLAVAANVDTAIDAMSEPAKGVVRDLATVRMLKAARQATNTDLNVVMQELDDLVLADRTGQHESYSQRPHMPEVFDAAGVNPQQDYSDLGGFA